MGKGNWCASNQWEEDGCEFVYIDLSEADEEGDCSENYNYFREMIEELLPNSFRWEDQWAPDQRDVHIIAKNGLFEIFTADNETSIVVGVHVRENSPAFAKSNLSGFSTWLFDKLWDIYCDKVRIRCGPWMSGKYTPSK